LCAFEALELFIGGDLMKMDFTSRQLRQLIREELTKSDKDEIKKMIAKEMGAKLEKALTKELKSKATKDEISDITKKVLKKLYKDLSFHHPYIIDRIKV
jgi:UDP-galactopyranose mutase